MLCQEISWCSFSFKYRLISSGSFGSVIVICWRRGDDALQNVDFERMKVVEDTWTHTELEKEMKKTNDLGEKDLTFENSLALKMLVQGKERWDFTILILSKSPSLASLHFIRLFRFFYRKLLFKKRVYRRCTQFTPIISLWFSSFLLRRGSNYFCVLGKPLKALQLLIWWLETLPSLFLLSN